MEMCPVRCCGLSHGAGRDPPLLARAMGWQAQAAHHGSAWHRRSHGWHPWLRSALADRHGSAAHPEFQTGDSDA